MSQRPSWLRASRMGADDIFRNPVNGEYISRMIKMAPETASAPTSRVTITVGLGGARRPKLKKTATSQETNTTKRGSEREKLSDWTNSDQPDSRNSPRMAIV